jgi:hypothetical protein
MRGLDRRSICGIRLVVATFNAPSAQPEFHKRPLVIVRQKSAQWRRNRLAAIAQTTLLRDNAHRQFLENSYGQSL